MSRRERDAKLDRAHDKRVKLGKDIRNYYYERHKPIERASRHFRHKPYAVMKRGDIHNVDERLLDEDTHFNDEVLTDR